MPESLDGRVETALHQCQTAPYRNLRIRDLTLPHWTVSHVVSGTVTLATGGHTYRVMPGDVMVHPPEVAFSETNADAGEHLWLACTALIHNPHAENLLDRYPVAPVVTLAGERLAAYRETFARLQAAREGNSPFRQAANLLELLAHLVEGWQDAGSVPRPPELMSPVGRFAPVIAHLRKHLAARVTRTDLARIAALHPTAFDRAFVRATGQTPLKMLAEMRFAQVQRLLETTDDTLETIAGATGFTDAAHLSRLFRARFGVAPGKWRTGVNRTKTGYLSPLSGE